MVMAVEKLIREYVAENFHLSLATCANNRPWICEVHFVYDDNLNFYFLSKPGRRHSKEIASNSNVAGNIIKQHAADEKPRGVYFEGIAEQLADIKEDSLAYRLYLKRFGTGQDMLDEIMNDPQGHKFYKITPKSWVLFDTVNFPDNSRQEWKP